MARTCSDVWTTSGATPAAAMRRPRGDGLGSSLLGEVGVVPAGEEVLEVPRALAVAEQDESRGHGPVCPTGRPRSTRPVPVVAAANPAVAGNEETV